ncbi:hypothetical protein FJT64_024290 [Amphibalanus amphitrite]|uniref:Uncharacterized protein n=1 Tax=Amphibalanus amphitrite TaxID=1232801 RepID=A0A6A4WF03_AMPAM|nr:hypothetical protein FJT64_024290 [Amphibalanus amphitrite]
MTVRPQQDFEPSNTAVNGADADGRGSAVDAIIRVEPNTIILPAGVGLIELTELRSSRETVKRLSVSAADLPRLRGQLPEGLKRLNIRGPEVTEPRWPGWDGSGLSVSLQGVAADTISHLADLGRTVELLEIYGPEATEQRWPEWDEYGLSVSLQGVAADTISHLTDLGQTVKRLEIYDCTDLTAGSLEPLTRCPELQYLTLSGGVPDTVSLEPLTRCPKLLDLILSGGIPDTVLDSLSGCPGLWELTLGDRQRPAETAFTAAAVTRLVKSCRKLYSLCLHCTADTSPGRADRPEGGGPGRDSDGRSPYHPVSMSPVVELFRQLKSQEGDGVDSVEVVLIDALHYRPCSDELTAERPSQSAGAAS